MGMEKTLNNEEVIRELLALLKKNAMKEEANDVFEICSYVDSLEKKLDIMAEELTNVRQELKDIKKDIIFNDLKEQVKEEAMQLQNRFGIMKEQLFSVKESVKFTTNRIVSEAKIKGKEALYKISEFFGIKDKLVAMRENVRASMKEVEHTVAKIDAFGTGIREANQKIANTFRAFADKEEADYSKKEKKLSKTEVIKKPWIAKKKILAGMELRLDAAIGKAENLARNVEVNQMMKVYDNLMDKAQGEKKSVAMAAGQEFQYGADAFEAYEIGKKFVSNNAEKDKIVKNKVAR